MNSISVTGKSWILKKFSETEVDYLKTNYFLDDFLSKLISIRNINKENVSNYLNPTIKNILPDPYILKDMDRAVKRAVKAIDNLEKVGVFGDYDVDGASSTALICNYLKKINLQFEIYIPDRRMEGFGPSINGFKKLISKGVNMIFTVDCGTMSFEAINYAKNQNIDVIVLDHHQSEINLPKAHSIINPNRFDDKSNLKYLCAAGVCFMFLIALNRYLENKNWFTLNSLKKPNLLNFLDLVTLGTVCDVVPLIDLNRAIVKQGLKVLKKKNNIGLSTLFDICNINVSPSPYHLGYVIGPRINAGGRVGKCSHGANLLLNTSSKESYKLASELNEFNKERRNLESVLLQKVLSVAYDSASDPILILSGNKWHEGIIGIIASRIKDKFNKPSIIISTDGKVSKGSARSIVGFDIGSLIIGAMQKGILIKGGGHKMAGGFSIETDKIDIFKKYVFNKFNSIEKKVVNHNLLIDSEISPSALNINFFDIVNKLAPFGSGNPEPRFAIENLKPINSKIVGEKHIKSVLVGLDGSTIKTMAFNAIETDISPYLLQKNSKFINIVGKLSLNEWKGQKNVEFIIDDISVNKENKNTVPSSIG